MAWDQLPFLLAVLYFVALLVVGALAGRNKRDSNQYLNATGALPVWVSVVSCVAANCGSLDVVAMMALGAQYGMLACHFYWIGAIPALLVLAFWLLPAYAQGRYPTVLDFVEHYYGRSTRSLVALCMAAIMMLLAGVCLCAVAQVMTAYLGWSFLSGVLLCAPLVLIYTWMGGFRATVYTELLHFAVVLVAIVPLFLYMLRGFGGFSHWLAAIPAARLHTWQTLPALDPGAPMDRFGLLAGLTMVLSFGFWGTDFVQMQRALAVRKRNLIPVVPLSVATAKLFFAFLIVLPGVTAPLLLPAIGKGHWNETLPALMLHYFAPAWIGVGVMGIAASLVSTFANNVAGFTSVWVQSVYQPWLRPRATDAHYLRVSRMSNAAVVLASMGTAYLALTCQSLMEYIQMILATFNAPIFALVGLGAVVPSKVSRGGLGGLGAGLICAIIHQILVGVGLLQYGSRMAANFYAAIFSFIVTVAGILIFNYLGDGEGATATASPAQRVPLRFTPATLAWAAVLAASFLLVTVWFW
jgi:SSS family solute:Na+ symporter